MGSHGNHQPLHRPHRFCPPLILPDVSRTDEKRRAAEREEEEEEDEREATEERRKKNIDEEDGSHRDS